MSHEEEFTIVATLCPIFLLVQHLNRCIFCFLRHATSPPHNDDDLAEFSEHVQLFCFVGQDLQELGREGIGPYRFSVRQRTDRLLYFVLRRGIVQWPAPAGHSLRSPTMLGSRVGVLMLSSVYETTPHPPLPDEGIILQQSTFLVLDVLRIKRPLRARECLLLLHWGFIFLSERKLHHVSVLTQFYATREYWTGDH